jgi:hypothetical protein
MLNLDATLSLLRRHSAQHRPSTRGSDPTSTAWHCLWSDLKTIRERAEGGEVECRDWLALNASLIQYVEACRKLELEAALTNRGVS